MKQKIIDYSLELFCACVIVLTLVRILFFPVLPLGRSLVCGYALIAVLMLAGCAVMQRATLSTTNLTYREFLGNVRKMALGRLDFPGAARG